MWNSKIFDQWRSYLSLKTSVLLAFFIIWNLGFVIAMYGFGNGFGAPITPQAGIVISLICMCTGIFSMVVVASSNVRQQLIEPKRALDYRAKDFYLLSFVNIILSLTMFFLPELQSA